MAKSLPPGFVWEYGAGHGFSSKHVYNPMTGQALSTGSAQRIARSGDYSKLTSYQPKHVSKDTQGKIKLYNKLVTEYVESKADQGVIVSRSQARSAIKEQAILKGLRDSKSGHYIVTDARGRRHDRWSADSPLAKALEALGRRPEGADWPVGETDTEASMAA